MPISANNPNGTTPSGTLSTSSSTSTISSLTLDPKAINRANDIADHAETTPTRQAEISKVTQAPIVNVDAQEVKHIVTETGEKVAAFTSATTRMTISAITSDLSKTAGKASALEAESQATHPRPIHTGDDTEKTQYLRDLYIKQYGDIFDVRPYGDLDEELATSDVYGDLMNCDGQAWNSSFWEDSRERK